MGVSQHAFAWVDDVPKKVTEGAYRELLEALVAHPGRWAKVRPYAKGGGTGWRDAMQSALYLGDLDLSRLEAVVRMTTDGTYWLFARIAP